MARPMKRWDPDQEAVIEDEAIKEYEDPDWRVSSALGRIMSKLPPEITQDMVIRKLSQLRKQIAGEEAAYRAHRARLRERGTATKGGDGEKAKKRPRGKKDFCLKTIRKAK